MPLLYRLKMVNVCFIIEKNKTSSLYINKFIEIFSKAKIGFFEKTSLLHDFKFLKEDFDDRSLFYYSGDILAYKTVFTLLGFSLIILLMASLFLKPIIGLVGVNILKVIGYIGLIVYLGYIYYISSYNFWRLNKKTFSKYNLNKVKYRKISNKELIDYMIYKVKPKFKGEE